MIVVHSADGSVLKRSIRLTPDHELLAVGRDVSPPGLLVQDSRLSRLHFRVAWDGRSRRYRLGDANSMNGTFVNTRRETTVLLNPGDVVRAGNTLFVYEEGDAMADVRQAAARCAATDLGVLILGETGVGKEVLAREIHERAGRTGDFVAVNCAALPKELAAAELFGHTRGAFSGATQARQGLFAAAAGGTLLLDEVGDLPADLQPALLRVLQEHAVRPVGADRESHIDVRVLAATHQDLERACAEGRFREDLYGRLAQVVLRIPALRDRRSEICDLTDAFAGRPLRYAADVAEALLTWPWPRNVRELKSLVLAFEATTEGVPFDVRYLRRACRPMIEPVVSRESTNGDGAERRGASPQREDLKNLLERLDGNISEVAKSLGKPRAQVYRWIKSFGLAKKPAR